MAYLYLRVTDEMKAELDALAAADKRTLTATAVMLIQSGLDLRVKPPKRRT